MTKCCFIIISVSLEISNKAVFFPIFVNLLLFPLWKIRPIDLPDKRVSKVFITSLPNFTEFHRRKRIQSRKTLRFALI